MPLAGEPARTGDDPGDGFADALRLGAVFAPDEVLRPQSQGVPSEQLVDPAPAETGDGGLVFEQLGVQANGAVCDFGGGEVFRSNCRAAAEVRETDTGLCRQQGVIFRPDIAPGESRLA